MFTNTTNYSNINQYSDSKVKLKLDADGVISGSSQVTLNNITNFDANVDTRLDAKTVISGSSQVNVDSITNFDTNVKVKLDRYCNFRFFVQVVANNITNFDTNVDDRLNGKTVISGSSQISLGGFSTTNLSEGTNQYYTDVAKK